MTERSPLPPLPRTWRDFAAFLRRPAPRQPIGLRQGWRTTAAMLGLNLIGLAVLLLVLPLWQRVAGIDGPTAFKDIPFHYLVPAVIVAAPLVEESLFRGWLSGRPRAFWLLGCVVAGAVLLFALDATMAAMALVAVLAAALGGWLALRKLAAPEWFARAFPALFYVSVVTFGLVHVFNYAAPQGTGPGLVHLPMVLPQLWAGLTLAFTRVQVGLPASMLVHAMSNGLALALVSLGG